MTLKEIMDSVSPLWGICPFEEIKENLIECRAKSHLPQKSETVITACFPYLLEASAYENRNISKYAVVTDYHEVAVARLQKAADKLRELYPENEFAVFADNSPIPEVKAACAAGLGVRGINSLLITKKYGSYVFIGEIVTDLKINTGKIEYKSCIGCKKCVETCPARAIDETDFRKESCLSAVTQKKGELSPEEEKLMRECGCVWGCDICQDVCPMNRNAAATEIEEFLSSPVAHISEGCELEGRAYEWRGRKVIERNLKISKKEFSVMKLIVAIINNDDCPSVLSELTHKGFGATRLSTSGGFLRAGNSTLLIGTEDEKVDEVIEVINEYSRKRTQMVSPSPSFMTEGFISRAVEVTVGGATVFVLDVDKFIKL